MSCNEEFPSVCLPGPDAFPERRDSDGFFPPMSVKLLNGNVKRVPYDYMGTICLYVVAFSKKAQADCESWLTPFSEKFGANPHIRYLLIPMIKEWWWWLSPLIQYGMKEGTPISEHSTVGTFYGNLSPYYTRLAVLPDKTAHCFLASRNGSVRWRGHGPSSPVMLQELFFMTAHLLLTSTIVSPLTTRNVSSSGSRRIVRPVIAPPQAQQQKEEERTNTEAKPFVVQPFRSLDLEMYQESEGGEGEGDQIVRYPAVIEEISKLSVIEPSAPEADISLPPFVDDREKPTAA